MLIMRIGVATIIPIAIAALFAPVVRGQAGDGQHPALTRGATHETRTPDVPGLTEATSLCSVSDDETYGVTPDNPVKVGGGAFYVKARSLRFLQALRGPEGQGLHFKRLGSFDHTDGSLLDMYEVEHGGTPRHIYIDAYRWAEPKAPRGWLCGAAMELGPPPARRQR